MENEKLLDEYVSNDIGKIWLGDEKSCRGRAWAFGQFEACVLPACQFMLERSGISDVFRRDPVRMSRVITRMVSHSISVSYTRDYHSCTSEKPPLIYT